MTNRELVNLVWPFLRHSAYCDRFPVLFESSEADAEITDCHCGLIGIRRRVKQVLAENDMMVGHIGGPDNSSVPNADGSITMTLRKKR
jgi:hypothetical protein